jgi:hypothetical protein
LTAAGESQTHCDDALVDARHPGTRSAVLALATFLGAEAVGFVFYVVKGRGVWFFGVFGDEWDFLAGRRLTVHDLLQPHGDHLVALPALIFRLLFTVFGLRTYLPYQLLAIATHVAIAALLRLVIRRAGVNAWVATAAATLFVFFGAGSENVLIAFQITFTGALALGLTQLLLADHPGRLDRRDALGVVAGLGALLCSNVALVMIAVVGVNSLLARRWRAAVVHVVPLAAVFVAWSAGYGRKARFNFDESSFVNAVRTAVSATFQALGQVPFVGWGLAAVLVAGLALAWRDTPRGERRMRFGLAVSMLVGDLAFVVILGLTRGGLGVSFLSSSRYLYVIAAMLLPALAIGCDAIIRRWRGFAPAVLALLVVGIPGNIGRTSANVHPSLYRHQKGVITSLAGMDLTRRTPRSLRPAPSFAEPVTVGWLVDGVASGRIPTSKPKTPRDLADNTLRLSLEQLDGGPASSCVPLHATVERTLETGQSVVVSGTMGVKLVGSQTVHESDWEQFGSSLVDIAPTFTLRAVQGPLDLRIRPQSFFASFC